MNYIKNQFLLNPDIVFLNHGSFGACPKPIFENYQKWQRALEFEPVQFITKKSLTALQYSKQLLGEYIGTDAADFFYIQNPTTAINQIVKSLNLQKGDEVLSTCYEYGAMDKTFDFYSQKKGIVYRRQKIPLPLQNKKAFISAFCEGYNEKTKAIFISAYTSTTALIFPVKEVCEWAKKMGLITIVDGAHVPGHLPLNIQELQADFYTGTLHKWLLAPKGCAFLYVNKNYQSQIEPQIISWGYDAVASRECKFLEENESQGTRDISAFLTTPAIMQFFEEYNMVEKQAVCRKTIMEQYPIFCDLVGAKPICSVSNDFLGQMCSIPINSHDPVKLKESLYNDYKIEIPIMQREDETYIRISYQVYNNMADLEQLKSAIINLQKKGMISPPTA